MKPEAKIFDALIGNTYESATVYPNIPTELGEDKVLIIDMPGTSFPMQGSAIRDTSTGFWIFISSAKLSRRSGQFMPV